ncbi:MAG: SipW-dependent-type signal peptide-containing protein [Micrococcales bacterium]|nr:SipW-dependent-type signal peptide-containing protein [Micrococcales bacterium]
MTTNTRSRKTGAIGAFALGFALLLVTGSTYALWTADEDYELQSDGEITAGSWTIAFKESEVTWWNVETDTDDGNTDEEEIDLATFKVVPGSVVEARMSVDVDLVTSIFDGDELKVVVSEVELDGTATPSADSPLVPSGARITSDGEIAITFTFPLDEDDYATQATETALVSFGGVVVTVTQVRPGHADL